MLSISSSFAAQMENTIKYVYLIDKMKELTKAPDTHIKHKHKLIISAREIKRDILKIHNLTVIAYDGSYLSACSDFELTIRKLVELYVERAALKFNVFNNLPRVLKEWYPEGCANLILCLNQDKLKHITKDNIMNSIASCIKPAKSGYVLIGEAFSNNERNFRSIEIDKIFSERLGIDKIWKKVARDPDLQKEFSITNQDAVEGIIKKKLDGFIQRRNDIVHRGRTYYSSSESEVIECASFFKSLIACLCRVMEAQVNAM